MPDYFSQTGSHIEIAENTSTSKNEGVVQNYKFVKNPVTFKEEITNSEDTISQEEEKSFYKKVFETKSF